MSIRVGIVGGSGYTGLELLRLLVCHPMVELVFITSRAEAGTLVSDSLPSFRRRLDLKFIDPAHAPYKEVDLVFFATPNGVAMQSAHEILAAGAKVIDLAADFRLKDPQLWRQWYGMDHHCPELLEEAVYGLCEINREQIRKARLVANPGCYPTAIQLGFLPLLEQGLVQPASLIADAKSGVSGAGKRMEQTYLYSEANENFQAYSVNGHRHLPEIVQGLEAATKPGIGLLFTPHLVPMIRGIHATLYATLNTEAAGDLQELFEKRYQDEIFVDVMPSGSHPQTKSVRGSNVCRIAVHRPQGGARLVILSVIDNLFKGAAGQAVQNMNIMFGLAEDSGLDGLAFVP
ncbi:MAG: N-acetyl-gamma-glutamyl-phosphate reductase [Gammaproteobacteria bacterium]|nr:N-acetyl-gamma-glutamyl-phosphate reductase [Gammaproteobacteria bacterium]MDH5694851.1 N-acetyl-gamma-glutamyl-phosphate reductase [Gammaproteobacteria bacterium]